MFGMESQVATFSCLYFHSPARLGVCLLRYRNEARSTLRFLTFQVLRFTQSCGSCEKSPRWQC